MYISQRQIFSSIFLLSAWKEKTNELLLCSPFFLLCYNTKRVKSLIFTYFIIFFPLSTTMAEETSASDVLLRAVTFLTSTKMTETYLVANLAESFALFKIQERIQYTMGISFHEREKSTCLLRTQSFSHLGESAGLLPIRKNIHYWRKASTP